MIIDESITISIYDILRDIENIKKDFRQVEHKLDLLEEDMEEEKKEVTQSLSIQSSLVHDVVKGLGKQEHENIIKFNTVTASLECVMQEVSRLLDAVKTFSNTIEGIMSEHFERVSKKLFNYEIDLLKEHILDLHVERDSLKKFLVNQLMEMKKSFKAE